MAKKEEQKRPNIPIKIKYDATSATYANQFILNQNAEEVFVDFSSGPIPDPTTGQTMIPIHSRVALSYQGAKRLGDLLLDAVKNHSQRIKK